MRVVYILLTVLVFGCASRPSSDPSLPANVAAPPPAPASAEPATAPASAESPDAASGPADKTDATAGAAPAGTNGTDSAKSDAKDDPGLKGYQVVERNGRKYFCAPEPLTGSRVARKRTCSTAEQLQRAREETSGSKQGGTPTRE